MPVTDLSQTDLETLRDFILDVVDRRRCFPKPTSAEWEALVAAGPSPDEIMEAVVSHDFTRQAEIQRLALEHKMKRPMRGPWQF